MKVVHFKSYGCDDYYMKVNDDFIVPTKRTDVAKMVEKYLDWEYFEPFKYTFITYYQVEKNGFVFIQKYYGEWWVLDADDVETNRFRSGLRYYFDHTYPEVVKMKRMSRSELLEYLNNPKKD